MNIYQKNHKSCGFLQSKINPEIYFDRIGTITNIIGMPEII